jgi:uncharacterized protein YlxW (UPF0749 family)
VGRSAQRVVETYDKSYESEKIAVNAQMAIAGTAAAGGAIGLGALLVVMTTTAAIDVTGVLTATLGLMLGLFILPNRRKAAKEDMSNRLAELRLHLVNTLTNQFEKELSRSVERIKEAISPYTRFVRSERDKLTEIQSELTGSQRVQARLRAEIDTLKRDA